MVGSNLMVYAVLLIFVMAVVSAVPIQYNSIEACRNSTDVNYGCTVVPGFGQCMGGKCFEGCCISDTVSTKIVQQAGTIFLFYLYLKIWMS